ncbi:MAG: transcriptional regulator [Robiginitomaculum sp.]|nr:MAG: transcriptional regulator [Robiginitomaculum sp.]
MAQYDPRKPHTIDTHVGSQIRTRRVALKMSQEKLGGKVGVSFQQVQKYERGQNRVGASRLFYMSKALEVPVSFFYNGLETEGQTPTQETTDTLQSFIQSPEGLRMARAFNKIKLAITRNSVIDMIENIAEVTDPAATS